MNNKIKAAVAGAVLASASVANAGITWDAGEWTVDMNGNVNAFAIVADDIDTTSAGGLGQRQVMIQLQHQSTLVYYHHG
jgi:hypothetical protein